MRTKWTWLAVVALLVLGASIACGDDDDELRVTVTAAIVEAGALATVETTDVAAADRGRLLHQVRVTWRGQDQAFLDDARFTHHVANGGDLVVAGRGCGAEWDATLRQVLHQCTDDLQIVRLEPGETHAYPVWIFPEMGPLALKPGIYVVDQRIPHWDAGSERQLPDYDRPAGEFTIRLTYTSVRHATDAADRAKPEQALPAQGEVGISADSAACCRSNPLARTGRQRLLRWPGGRAAHAGWPGDTRHSVQRNGDSQSGTAHAHAASLANALALAGAAVADHHRRCR